MDVPKEEDEAPHNDTGQSGLPLDVAAKIPRLHTQNQNDRDEMKETIPYDSEQEFGFPWVISCQNSAPVSPYRESDASPEPS